MSALSGLAARTISRIEASKNIRDVQLVSARKIFAALDMTYDEAKKKGIVLPFNLEDN
jgi:hypothetical protein